MLVPRIWKLSLNYQTRVFLDRTVPEIVQDVLKAAGFGPDDFEFRLSGREYAKKEYVVQYQESDLDFLSRLLEHQGIFYFFEQTDLAEKIIFGNSEGAYQPIPGDPLIRYEPLQDGGTRSTPVDWFREEQIQSLTCRQKIIQTEVKLGDFNYRTPSVPLKNFAPVAEDGFGTHYLYGEHYKNQEEGKELARVRAEELNCRERVFEGGGEARAFHAGLTYQLTNHYREDVNREYLITEVRHQGKQAISLRQVSAPVASYTNEFVCIPTDRVFRPERRTIRPRISGLLNARVDAGGSGQYAEIDDLGRYKIQLPFDLSEAGGGKASRFMRMAQPYAGGGMGMHFPLHKGTEVILAHVNGDPDRPIIVAAVPNPETASPVSGGNHTQCKIATGGGNLITLEDVQEGERIEMSTPFKGTYIKLGSPRPE